MRTSVEITEAQHRALTALAAQRNLRDFSPLVQEAIDTYVEDHEGEELRPALRLGGTVSAEDADEIGRRIAEAWSEWPTSR